MVRNTYEYGTTPRKLEPEKPLKKQGKKKKIRVVEDLPRQDIRISKEQKRKQYRLTLIVVSVFILLLTISYRNSQINEKFNNVQSLKRELTSLQKENEQLEVSIVNSLNLSTVEKQAKDKLGMQKLANKQIIYVTLPKRDYVETTTEKIETEKEKNWFEKFVDKIFNR